VLLIYEKLKKSEFYFCFDNIKIKIFPIIEFFLKRKLYLIGNLKVSSDKVIFNDRITMNFLEIEGNENDILEFINNLRKHFNLVEWKISKLETALKFNYGFY